MSYEVARARVAKIVEGARVQLSQDLGHSSLKHDPDGGGNIDDAPRAMRRFYMETATDRDGRIEGPFTPDIGQQPRAGVGVVLVVQYRDLKGRRVKMDFLIEQDALEIAKVLLTPDTLARTTSNIDYIEEVSWRRQILSNDDVDLRVTFTLHYI